MDVRQFIFFNDADEILFTRTDAESANWQVDELTLTCLFPYVPEKTIRRGMRIAFEDDDGVLQPFEIRKVRNYEPDRYQEITCEHIVISELTDAHTGEHEFTGVTPASALSTLLFEQPSGLNNEKRWAVGNVTATDTSSGDISIGSVWQNVRTIETNWNVYILPRVTWNESGITGRYLDIIPAAGVWHGLRLSIDKNTDEAGVTVDDTEVKTALFGYGGNSFTMKTDNLDKDKEAVTLVGYTWPGKPSGAAINSTLGYIEDTAATAIYGRNGVPRFGFYQNGDISDQATLAQKTWEALQTTNKPTVTVDCIVKDLYRLGYHDEKIRLHDTVMIDLLPMNDVLQLEIIKLSVDLLDPTGTRPTIGEYVPNIIYIQRQTMERASGGAGGGISGRRGGETEAEAKWSEFQAEFVVNNAIMSYHAVQVDHDNKVLKAAGMDIDASGVITYAEDNVNMIGSKFKQTAGRIDQEIIDRSNADTTLQSNITQEAGRITQIVTAVGTNGEVTAASIITAIDNDTSSVTISANKIDLNGLVTATEFQTALASIDNLVGDLNVVGAVTVGGNLSAGSLSAESYSDYKVDGESIGLGNVIKSLSLTGPTNNVYTLTATQLDGDTVQIGTFSRATSLSGRWSGRYYTVTATPQNETKTGIVYDGLVPTGSITKNGVNVSRDYIVYSDDGEGNADTIIMQKTVTINAQDVFDDGVASVSVDSVDLESTDIGDVSYDYNPGEVTLVAKHDGVTLGSDIGYLYLTTGNWNSSHKKAVNIRVGGTAGNRIARIWVTAPSPSVGTPYIYNPAQNRICAAVVVNGQTYYGAYHNASDYT